MSKLNKFIKTPGLFFNDMLKKRQGNIVSVQTPVATKPVVAPVKKVLPIKVKTLVQYVAEMKAFSSSFNVNTIKVGDELIWPYYRSHLLSQYTMLATKKNLATSSKVLPSRLTMGTELEFPYSLRKHFSDRYNVKYLDEIECSGSTDFLFLLFTNAAEQVDIEGEIHFRISDPVYEVAKKIGSARRIEIIKSNSRGIDKSKKYHYPAELIFFPFIQKTGYANSLKFNFRFFEKVKKHLTSISFVFADFLQLVDCELNARDFYIDLLKKINPKILFLQGFHMVPGLISAAKSLQIPVVDVQHGIQVGWFPIYNDWSEAPSDGYQTMPDNFFVWSKKEVENIKAIFPNSTPFLIGNPWIAKQLIEDFKSTGWLNNIKTDNKIIVLVALQDQLEIPEFLIDLFNNTGDKFFWVIRHHPKAAKKFTLSDYRSASSRPNDVFTSPDVEFCPLVPLFRDVAAVVSEGSTVNLEASLFGLPSLVYGERAADSYAEEIRDGTLRLFENAADFIEILCSQRENNQSAAMTEDILDSPNKIASAINCLLSNYSLTRKSKIE